MAINSVDSRSQNQLHIHVDCVRADVRRALAAREHDIGSTWAPLDLPPSGRRYRARRLVGADLGARDPFVLLAAEAGDARREMARQSLAVIGAQFDDGSPGFILLADGGAHAFAEGLLDHGCAVLNVP
jgi:CDP-diacylglycerol pyrophosphatase